MSQTSFVNSLAHAHMLIFDRCVGTIGPEGHIYTTSVNLGMFFVVF